jgi:hypothetical protein
MRETVQRRVVRLGSVFTFSLVAACHSSSKAPPPAAATAPSNVPVSVVADPLPQGAVTVLITPSTLSLKGDPDVEIAPVPSDTSHGFDPASKADGQNPLYVTPLGKALQARGPAGAVTVMAAPSIAYRMVVEVLYTAGKALSQPELKSCFAVRAPGRPPEELHALCLAPPRPPPPPATPSLGTTVIIMPEGFIVKAGRRTVAPGCKDVGTGITVPKSGIELDYAGLTTCLANVKHLAPKQLQDESTVLISANPDLPFQAIVSTMDAARQTADGEKLYPDATFGVNEVGRPGAIVSDAAAPGAAARP